MFELKGKVVVVTGALGLLGREHCASLARAGASLVVADLDGVKAEAFAKQLIESYGISAYGLSVDISYQPSVQKLHQDVRLVFDHTDVLVNNAAIDDKIEERATADDPTRLENYPLAAWKKVVEVNVTGTFICCQIFGQEMAARGQGSIINIAPTYGIVAPDQSLYRAPDGSQPFFKTAAYPVSKAAVIGLTKFLASYWGRSGVRVNALCPGGVQTSETPAYFQDNYAARTPLGRMADPGDFCGALIFLASDESRYMTGANLVIDGGWTAC
jgi:NAD(P)-dependent dehydrogenase (short-subunit alcohol dehydrogenase family)